MPDFDVRFVAYDLETFVDILPAPQEFSFANPHCDDSTLTMKYSALSQGGQLAKQLLNLEYDVAVELNFGSGWTEYQGSRFYMTEDADDPLDPTGMISFTGVNAASYDLSGVVEFLQSRVHPDRQTVRFTNSSAGRVLRTWTNDCKAIGVATAVNLGFTDTTDSAGSAWSVNFAQLDLQPSLSAQQLLQQFTAQFTLDWKTQGNTLLAYNPDTVLKRMRDGTGASPEVALALGKELTDGPRSRSRRGFISDVLTISDAGVPFRVSKNITSKRGRRFGVAPTGGITSKADSLLVANGLFNTSGKLIREQFTRTLNLQSPAVDFLPYRDYLPGDYVTGPGSAQMESLRVRVITITGGPDGYGGNVVLNDRFLEKAVLAARRYAALSGGATGSPVGGAPTVPSSGKRLPKPPSGVVGNAIAFINTNGQADGSATITWSPVSVDNNDIPIGIARYRVRGRRKVA